MRTTIKGWSTKAPQRAGARHGCHPGERPGSATGMGSGRRLGGTSAGPVHDGDPDDPELILRDLPEGERGEFLRQYREAVDAAHDLAGYRHSHLGHGGGVPG